MLTTVFSWDSSDIVQWHKLYAYFSLLDYEIDTVNNSHVLIDSFD